MDDALDLAVDAAARREGLIRLYAALDTSAPRINAQGLALSEVSHVAIAAHLPALPLT